MTRRIPIASSTPRLALRRWIASAALLLFAMSAYADDLRLGSGYFNVDFDHPIRVGDAPSPSVTTEPAADWTCRWQDDTTLECEATAHTPLATEYRIHLPALMRADGQRRPAQVLDGETFRPYLRAVTPFRWTDGMPEVVLSSEFRLMPEALRHSLEFRSGDRVWPVVEVVPMPGQGRDRETTTLVRIDLPPDIADDTRVRLVAKSGLRSEDGPLPSVREDVLTYFHVREPFRVRAVQCQNRGVRLLSDHERPQAGSALLTCNANARIEVLLSACLDEASFFALQRSLPTGMTLTRAGSAWDWDAYWDRPTIMRPIGDEVLLIPSLPVGARTTVTFDAGLRDIQGRALEPVTLSFLIDPPAPPVRPPPDWLDLPRGKYDQPLKRVSRCRDWPAP